MARNNLKEHYQEYKRLDDKEKELVRKYNTTKSQKKKSELSKQIYELDAKKDNFVNK